MNKTFFLPLVILIFVFYYFFFPVKGGSEMFLAARDAQFLDTASLPLDENLIFGRQERKIVYYADSRDPFLPQSRMGESAVSDEFYLYKLPGRIIIRDLRTGQETSITSDLSPLISHGHLYDADFGRSRIREVNPDGSLLWQWQGLAPITAFAASRDCTAIASVDGIVRLFTKQGHMRELLPEGELDFIVYGLALSPDCTRLAMVSGLENQWLKVYDLPAGGVLLWSEKLESAYNQPVQIYSSRDGIRFWLEQPGKLVQYSQDYASVDIDLDGALLNMELDAEDNILMLLTEQGKAAAGNFVLSGYSLDGRLLYKSFFQDVPEDMDYTRDGLFFLMGRELVQMERVLR